MSLKGKKLTFVEYGALGGVYLDGKLVIEGYTLSPWDVLRALGLEIHTRTISGSVRIKMPKNLRDLKDTNG